MCGIAGWIRRSAIEDGSAVLRRMTDEIAHRGPDGEGQAFLALERGAFQVAFGNRRLAIIDLPGGAQPMAIDGGASTITYNGEVYNYRELRDELRARGRQFVTESDTEVILRAYAEWGLDCVPRLRGMFAFALHDRERDRVVFARDAFGKKPLYLLEHTGGLAFASEIDALLPYPGLERRLDRGSVHDLLVNRYVPGPNTLFEQIKKLPPGHVAVFAGGALTVTCYYTPPDRCPPAKGENGATRERPEGAVVDEFRALFDQAVRLRMRSDAPYGAFLSGGIDSSAVVAAMSRASGAPVRTFSIGFEERKYSESWASRLVAERFGTEHQEMVASPREIMDHLPLLVRRRGAPVSEPSDIPIYLLARAASRSVKMVLTGEGADEMLAGYPKHRVEPHVAAYQAVVPESLHDRLLNPLVQALPYRFRRWKIAMDAVGERSFERRMERWFGAIPHDVRRRLWNGPATDREPDPLPTSSCRDASALRRVLFFDQTSWLPDNLLERGDRMTMAASIEGRMPFMDTEIAAFVSALPDSFRIRRGSQKWLLRRAMDGVLPRQILDKPKVGFRVPVNEWFRGPLRGWLEEHLRGKASRTRRLLDAPTLDRMLDEHLAGRQNHEKIVWVLVNLEIALRELGLDT